MTLRSNLQAIDRSEPGAAGTLQPLAAERTFYSDYPWSLNPLCTVGEAAGHLERELSRLGVPAESWQRAEAMINVFLLAGALLTAVEDALRGPVLRVPHRLVKLPGMRLVIRALDLLTAAGRARQSHDLRRWRDDWQAALDAFLRLLAAETAAGADDIAAAARGLTQVLARPLPVRLQAELIRIPSAFRKQDLTHGDVVELADRFAAAYPDRTLPVAIVGLRTAGVYFAALMRARLAAHGFARTAIVTIRPNKGPSAEETRRLRTLAQAGYHAALIDDPPFSGDTIGMAVQILRRAGFGAGARSVLFPVHPLRRDWREHKEAAAFARESIITLPPEDWHKARLLADDDMIEARLGEYFLAQGYRGVAVVEHHAAAAFNAELEYRSGDCRRHRLKRVYTVRLDSVAGSELRYVFAKSVGWGWLAYAAFLTADRLGGRVPPLIGLRDGILYTEWLPQTAQTERAMVPRHTWIAAAATYVAARAERLPVPTANEPDAQHEGLTMLAETLSAAYGPGVAGLMAAPLRRRLAARLESRAALIDGRMAADEWIAGPGGLLKTDFEHHGIGKNEINLCDPAYDLADAALQLDLTRDEQAELLARYGAATGDAPAGERLLLCKLMAGLWTRQAALDGIVKQTHLAHRAGEFNAQYVKAWNFLTRESARYSGALCPPKAPSTWRAPLAVLDLDGVVDRRTFGFPTTTAAGLDALALLGSRSFAIAVDTARPAHQVRDYCEAYGFVGGVAECGSYIWDATTSQGRVLLDDVALEQLAALRALLKAMPGIFVDDGYGCSIRAYTYARKGTVPLPELLVRNLIAENGFDRLLAHQTTIDTTILAKDVDKGTGLAALLAWTGHAGDTVAVGDSETDLPMFAVAGRSFAPAHIDCARLARAVGCEIAQAPFQCGLLEIAQRLVGAHDAAVPAARDDVFWSLLKAADCSRAANLWRALREPTAYRVFLD
ncbi:MAG: HAD hydrolase family protein [Alphaproteobacteria bacterium]|nr:HAD hydrolase family protein [Alphaproteobacteria bacterium]